jgi:LmbE family N-acetylglucosaminyl deacetylase
MISLTFGKGSGAGLRTVLCLGAHCDDIEIGCGGTILRLIQENPQVMVYWVVFSSESKRADETRCAAKQFLAGAQGGEVVIQDFRDGFLPFNGSEVKESFEALKRTIVPDVIFTHYRNDLHQDHRLISDLTWNTFRNHLILEYEIPKYDGDMSSPNFYVPLAKETCQRKIDTLLECFASQGDKRWFAADTFFSLMRLRGMECNAPSGYAEGFYCRKAVV